MRAALVAAIVATFVLALSATAHAATIMVNSLADSGAPGICVLRAAITAANTKTAIHGCVAGDGNDTIQFNVTGTIALARTLPEVVALGASSRSLTIHGPASPGITISGDDQVLVMTVAPGATLNLNHLTIANGFSDSIFSPGGIDNSGTLTITNSTFSGNRGSPGGIDNSGTLTVINSTFDHNRAMCTSCATSGGSIYNLGRLTVIDSTFSANIATADGGGIFNDGTLSITNSTFSANSATFDGGGIENGGTGTVSNSTFSANRSTEPLFGGGGIDNEGMLTISNSTFSGNSSAIGGGISNTIGTLTISNSTFSANRARTGGAIYKNREFGAVTHLKSTIVAASDSSGNCVGMAVDAGYNISDDQSCGFSATGSLNNTNPMLDPTGLSNNGGPTQTIALLSGSPAIDAIPLADCTDLASPPNPIITDQRLFPRPDAGETNCDIGAYEVQDAAFTPFSRFHGGLRIHLDTGVLLLSSKFELGSGGSIDARTQPVAFGIGSYALRLPVGSFVGNGNGYVYQKAVNGIFLCIFIKFTDTPGSYRLLVYRKGGILPISPVPVTLTIGDNSGSTQMNAKSD